MNKKLRILHIFVRVEYWEQARKGGKDEEYREIKPYWTKMLSKDYDLIYYHRKYTKYIRIFRWDGYSIKKITHKEFGNKEKKVYAISLRKPI